jgi:hypothetical protein
MSEKNIAQTDQITKNPIMRPKVSCAFKAKLKALLL